MCGHIKLGGGGMGGAKPARLQQIPVVSGSTPASAAYYGGAGNLAPGCPPAAAPATPGCRTWRVVLWRPTWSQIVRQCMDGDSGAWAELVRTPPSTYLWALLPLYRRPHRCRRPLTQDVFLKGLFQPVQLRHRTRKPAGLDHHPDPQPAGRQFSPHPATSVPPLPWMTGGSRLRS